MKKLIVAISMVAFVLFVYTANASNVRQDKPKSVVTVTGKTTTTGGAKCCPGSKKTDAKCCAGDKKTTAKKDTKTTKVVTKKDVKCDAGKASGCAKKCTGAK